VSTLREAAEEFLTQHRIAVAGVSRDSSQPANLVYRRLRDAGHEVFAVNPNADVVEGVSAFDSVASIPGGVDGVVIVTTPDAAASVAADCVNAGVPRVWLHRGIGPGSISEDAIARCREGGVSVIAGGCPNMFGATSDLGHRCMRAVLALGGRIPRAVADDDYPRVRAAAPSVGDAARSGGREREG
jgi:predicted CoA-binding protein